MNNKLLFATPRTGSNHILAKLDSYNLGEFFGGNPPNYEQENDKKIKCIMREGYPYLKVFPSHLRWKKVKDFLEENYSFVCLRRRNLIDQILSYYIAVETNQWIYSEKHVITLAPNSIIARFSTFKTITNEIRNFYRYLNELSCKKEFITMEDYIKDTKGKTPYIFNKTTYIKNNMELLGWIDRFEREMQPIIETYYSPSSSGQDT